EVSEERWVYLRSMRRLSGEGRGNEERRTLYGDWKLRREHLGNSGPAPHVMEQLKVLDDLLNHHKDDPTALEPALSALPDEMFPNSRAIILRYHAANREEKTGCARSVRLDAAPEAFGLRREHPSEFLELGKLFEAGGMQSEESIERIQKCWTSLQFEKYL